MVVLLGVRQAAPACTAVPRSLPLRRFRENTSSFWKSTSVRAKELACYWAFSS